MPAKFMRKIYRPNSFYHVFNRGAFKTQIFRDPQDFLFFLACTREAAVKNDLRIPVFCVMPNHFHFQVYQIGDRDMVLVMHSVLTRYGMYFCKKYRHSGKIFQGAYKAVLLTSKEIIAENREYILSNPTRAGLKNWPYVGENLA